MPQGLRGEGYLSLEAIVCRCEEVTLGEVKRAIREGARTVTAVKRRTRAGMGLCQGRTCEPVIMRILARELGSGVSAFEPATARPPVLPVTFGVLAGEDGETGS